MGHRSLSNDKRSLSTRGFAPATRSATPFLSTYEAYCLRLEKRGTPDTDGDCRAGHETGRAMARERGHPGTTLRRHRTPVAVGLFSPRRILRQRAARRLG